jgi:hypothetical protein
VITGENQHSPVFTALSYQVNTSNCYMWTCMCEVYWLSETVNKKNSNPYILSTYDTVDSNL